MEGHKQVWIHVNPKEKLHTGHIAKFTVTTTAHLLISWQEVQIYTYTAYDLMIYERMNNHGLMPRRQYVSRIVGNLMLYTSLGHSTCQGKVLRHMLRVPLLNMWRYMLSGSRLRRVVYRGRASQRPRSLPPCNLSSNPADPGFLSDLRPMCGLSWVPPPCYCAVSFHHNTCSRLSEIFLRISEIRQISNTRFRRLCPCCHTF